MAAKILTFRRIVNGAPVEQRRSDGYVNATQLSKAHRQATGERKDSSEWLSNKSAQSAISKLSAVTGIPVTALVQVKQGGKYQGTWIHPRLAVRFAMWLNDDFSLQVEDWVHEWFTTGQNPILPVQVDLEEQFVEWQQRYDLRMYLKDFLRPELMVSVVQWAVQHGVNPRNLCSEVHDTMNERIQGAKSQQIRLMGKLPLGVLIRDYFEASPLVGYCAINRSARNMICDDGMHPVDAVHKSCDYYLGKSYIPKLAPIAENVHAQGRRLRSARRQRQLEAGIQLNLNLLGDSQVS